MKKHTKKATKAKEKWTKEEKAEYRRCKAKHARPNNDVEMRVMASKVLITLVENTPSEKRARLDERGTATRIGADRNPADFFVLGWEMRKLSAMRKFNMYVACVDDHFYFVAARNEEDMVREYCVNAGISMRQHAPGQYKGVSATQRIKRLMNHRRKLEEVIASYGDNPKLKSKVADWKERMAIIDRQIAKIRQEEN